MFSNFILLKSKLIYQKLSVLRESFIWLLPLFILSSFVQFIVALEHYYIFEAEFVRFIGRLNTINTLILPFAITVAISKMITMSYTLPRYATSGIMAGILGMIMALLSESNWVSFAYFIAIILPFLVVPLLNKLYLIPKLQIIKAGYLSLNLTSSLNILIPAFITTALSYLIVNIILLISNAFILGNGLGAMSGSLPHDVGSYLFTFLNSILWSLGIHGSNTLTFLLDDITQSTPYSILNVYSAFVFIGGSGATFALMLAILIVSKAKHFRVLAFTSFPFALFNINELLVFGLPIVLNIKFVIPFVLAPIINLIIANIAIFDLGIINLSTTNIPFVSPVGLNAWLASNESFNGVLLQLFLIGIDTLIYIPFVLWSEKATEGKLIYFKNFGAHFTTKKEESIVLLDDSIIQQVQTRLEHRQIISYLEELSKKEFFLQYQPQICPHLNKVVGAESLIRAYDEQRNIIPPYKFLPWFEKAKLNKEVDKWAVNMVVDQINTLYDKNIYLPISVNINIESFLDEPTLKEITNTIKECKGELHIEITEGSFANDVEALKQILNGLKQYNVKIYIDDFGTGYSSLSYLPQYPIDAIKIDRSFVLTLDNIKGKKLFDGITALSKELELKLVIEGVETQEQLSKIEENAYTSIQGWYYAKSLNPEDFEKYVLNFNR